MIIADIKTKDMEIAEGEWVSDFEGTIVVDDGDSEKIYVSIVSDPAIVYHAQDDLTVDEWNFDSNAMTITIEGRKVFKALCALFAQADKKL